MVFTGTYPVNGQSRGESCIRSNLFHGAAAHRTRLARCISTPAACITTSYAIVALLLATRHVPGMPCHALAKLTISVIEAYSFTCGMQQHSMPGSLHSACLCFTSACSTLHGKTDKHIGTVTWCADEGNYDSCKSMGHVSLAGPIGPSALLCGLR